MWGFGSDPPLVSVGSDQLMSVTEHRAVIVGISESSDVKSVVGTKESSKNKRKWQKQSGTAETLVRI